jgi:hypothetical protein
MHRFAERTMSVFIGAAWNRDPYPTTLRVGTNPTSAVAFVAHHALGPQSRTPSTAAFDGALFHQRLEHRRLELLPGRQRECHQLAVPFGADMDLGRESAAAPA